MTADIGHGGRGTGASLHRAAGGPDPVARAIATARRLDTEIHALVEIFSEPGSAKPGTLDGMSHAPKNFVDLAGRAPTPGLAESRSAAAATTAAVIAMLRAQGARRIGFAAMTPPADEPSGGNPEQGGPIIPRGAIHFCGSGSPVAVAAACFLLRVTRSQTILFSNSTKPFDGHRHRRKMPR
jgi:Asp-tRNA(Asn)/Glu-tRNA(Gln) amidotransferase A subunit family amidase